MLQFDVPKLVDRACLPENAALVSISEKAHESPWKLMAQR